MPNRTICEVLEAMRQSNNTRNFSYLDGLIEEAQYLANRMEAALWDQRDFKRTQEKHKDLREEVKQLKAEARKLKGQPKVAADPFGIDE